MRGPQRRDEFALNDRRSHSHIQHPPTDGATRIHGVFLLHRMSLTHGTSFINQAVYEWGNIE